MEKIKVSNITENTRIDKFLALNMEISRKLIEKYFEQDLITVNNKKVKKKYKVKENDLICIAKLQVEDDVFEPRSDIEVDIIFENSDYAIVNKQRGLVVHPAPGHKNDTLVNALMSKLDNLSTINGSLRPGIVHRIDKDTSGLLIIAKNNHAHQNISSQLSSFKPKRHYYAIVEGLISNNYGTINAPIGRDPKDRKKYCVCAQNSKDSITHFEVIKRYKDKTLVKCILETGRTHQIRVHMNYISHPIIGDVLYNKKTKPNEIFNKGQALHAKTIGFIDPKTNEEVTFESNLDDYMKKIINYLENN